MTIVNEMRPRRMLRRIAPDDDDSTGAPGLMSAGIEIAVRILDPAWRRVWPSPARRIRHAARIAFDAASHPSRGDGLAAELAIVLADDGTVRRLNREYRGIDKPTNVLSFEGTGGAGERADLPAILGDVVLARQTVAAEAAAQGKKVADHAVHLVVHGVLHLLGHDHQVAREASLMESIEIRALARLGVDNPYAAPRPRRDARRRTRIPR
jgi:probable rRNA maturation factor